MRFAVVHTETGVVANIIILEDKRDYTPPENHKLIRDSRETVSEGMIYDFDKRVFNPNQGD